MNNNPYNRNTKTINTYILVNQCNSSVWTRYNCIRSIHVAMVQIYEITVSSEIVYLCISGAWIRNNSVICNSICVTVIHINEITVFSITDIYMNTVNSVLNVRVTMIQVHDEITVSIIMTIHTRTVSSISVV